jgi:hypothetical protein
MMHPLAHLFFGGIIGTCLLIFWVEYPRSREGSGKSGMPPHVAILVILILAGLAAFPQVSRFIGDGKLDTGPSLNLFLFHDILNLAGQKFRLGEGVLDPPVTISALVFSISLILLVYIRSERSRGWYILLRDLAYLSVIAVCMVGVRSAVSGKNYLFLDKTYVYVHTDPYAVVDDLVLELPTRSPVVGQRRSKAIAVRDAFLAFKEASWNERPRVLNVFISGAPPLEYNNLVTLLNYLEGHPEAAPQGDIERIRAAGTLPRRSIPLPLILALPPAAIGLCVILLRRWLVL